MFAVTKKYYDASALGPGGSSVSFLPLGGSGGGGGGTAQKQPLTYIVGTADGSPDIDADTWTLPSLVGSWPVLMIGNLGIPLKDPGDDTPYITKALGSDTLQIFNYTWQDGDILTLVLITP